MILYGRFRPGIYFLLPKGTFAHTPNNNYKFAPRRVLPIIFQKAGQAVPSDFLKFFSYLPYRGGLPVPGGVQQSLQRVGQPVGRLVEHRCPCLLFEIFQHSRPLFFIHRQKSLKNISSGIHSRKHQSRYAGRGPRSYGHRYALLITPSRHILSRIGNSRHTSVGDKGDVLPRLQLFDKRRAFCFQIMLVIARHGGLYIKVVQKPECVPCVLRGDKIHGFQYFHGSEGHIPQIAYGSGAQI